MQYKNSSRSMNDIVGWVIKKCYETRFILLTGIIKYNNN